MLHFFFLFFFFSQTYYSLYTQYSGGQASEGQGGFYGSGGARAVIPSHTEEHRPEMLALAADVNKVMSTMQELEVLENSLHKEKDMISPKAIEIRQSIKKLMTSPEFLKCLNRLQVQGSPVWGLSSAERELIIHAREKVNEC